MFYILVLLITVVDQLSKYWIRMNLNVGESFELWKGVLTITHYENSGIAFSSFQGYGRYFVPFAILTVVFIINIRKRLQNKRLLFDIGTGFLCGGAIGNAIDRIFYNQVTDFIAFHFNHGILNFSDYAINVGILFMFIDWFVSEIKKKRLII
jgi:signal peptidase II